MLFTFPDEILETVNNTITEESTFANETTKAFERSRHLRRLPRDTQRYSYRGNLLYLEYWRRGEGKIFIFQIVCLRLIHGRGKFCIRFDLNEERFVDFFLRVCILFIIDI